MSNRYRGNTQGTAAVIRNLIERYEDGEITVTKVEEVLDHTERLISQGSKSVRDWRKRFEALAK